MKITFLTVQPIIYTDKNYIFQTYDHIKGLKSSDMRRFKFDKHAVSKFFVIFEFAVFFREIIIGFCIGNSLGIAHNLVHEKCNVKKWNKAKQQTHDSTLI